MGSGKRYNCGKCFSTKDYDSKLQYCRKCGWSPIKFQSKLNAKEEDIMLEEAREKKIDCDGCKHLIYERDTNAYVCTLKSGCDKDVE